MCARPAARSCYRPRPPRRPRPCRASRSRCRRKDEGMGVRRWGLVVGPGPPPNLHPPRLIDGEILMTKTPATPIQERLAWKLTPEGYDQIRRLWIKHSIAEDRRDLQGLID